MMPRTLARDRERPAHPAETVDLSQIPILMTTGEVAQLLRVDRSTISRWRASGTGPPVTWLSPNTPRYQRVHVLEWLQRARA